VLKAMFLHVLTKRTVLRVRYCNRNSVRLSDRLSIRLSHC